MKRTCWKAPLSVALLVSLLMAGSVFGEQPNSFEYFGIQTIKDGQVLLLHYHAEKKEYRTVRPSNYVHLWPQAANILSVLPNPTIDTTGEIDSFLVRNGLAEVVGSGAPASLNQEEASAKVRRAGMWANIPEVAPAPQPVDSQPVATNQGSGDSNVFVDVALLFYKFWKEIVALGLIGGVLSFAVRWTYRRFWIRRRVVMSVVGLKGSGKTSILERFNPQQHLTEKNIEDMVPTVAPEPVDIDRPVPIGRFEVHARLRDNRGDDWGAFFETMADNRGFGTHIALLVMAPTDEVGATASNWKKDDFIVEQIGLAKGLVGGCLESSVVRKPSLIIIYLNKFDLVSEHSPDDASSRHKVEDFKRVFGAFLNQKIIAIHDRRSPPPIVRIIVGSALKDWGSQALMAAIREVLYMEK